MTIRVTEAPRPASISAVPMRRPIPALPSSGNTSSSSSGGVTDARRLRSQDSGGDGEAAPVRPREDLLRPRRHRPRQAPSSASTPALRWRPRLLQTSTDNGATFSTSPFAREPDRRVDRALRRPLHQPGRRLPGVRRRSRAVRDPSVPHERAKTLAVGHRRRRPDRPVAQKAPRGRPSTAARPKISSPTRDFWQLPDIPTGSLKKNHLPPSRSRAAPATRPLSPGFCGNNPSGSDPFIARREPWPRQPQRSSSLELDTAATVAGDSSRPASSASRPGRRPPARRSRHRSVPPASSTRRTTSTAAAPARTRATAAPAGLQAHHGDGFRAPRSTAASPLRPRSD